MNTALKEFSTQNPNAVIRKYWVPYVQESELISLNHGMDNYVRNKSNKQNRTFLEHYEMLYGALRSKEIINELIVEGRNVNIKFDFNFDIVDNKPAYLLMHLAQEKYGSDVSTMLVNTILRGRFEKGRDISNLDYLINVGSFYAINKEDIISTVLSRDNFDVIRAKSSSIIKEHRVENTPTYVVCIGDEGTTPVPKMIIKSAQDPKLTVQALNSAFSDFQRSTDSSVGGGPIEFSTADHIHHHSDEASTNQTKKKEEQEDFWTWLGTSDGNSDGGDSGGDGGD